MKSSLLLRSRQLQSRIQSQPMEKLLKTCKEGRRKLSARLQFLPTLTCHFVAAIGKTGESLQFACKTCSWWPWR